MVNLILLLIIMATVVAIVVGAFLVLWLMGRISAQKREALLAWVDIAVAAAQQLYHDYSGERRLTYALSVLHDLGYDVDSFIVLDIVEAAVLKLPQQVKNTSDDV